MRGDSTVRAGGRLASVIDCLLFRWPSATLPHFDRLKQRHWDLPESCGSGQGPVKSNYLRVGRLRESDQVAVGDRFRGGLEGKGRDSLPEQGLGAPRLGHEFYAGVLGPPVV